MKYYEIVVFILCLHVSVAMVNATGIFHTGIQHNEAWFNRLYLSTQDEYAQEQVESDNQDWGVGDFLKGLGIFIWNFGVGIIIVPTTLGAFGLTSPYIYYLSVLIYFIYVAAIAQFVSDRQIKVMS